MATKYALQHLFAYGWDYTGSEDGERLLFDSEQEGIDEVKDTIAECELQGMGYADEWRIVPYIESDDSQEDL